MSKLERQLREDRALRNAAKTVLMADLDHARTTFSAKGMADRVGGRIGDGAKDVFDVAKTHADDNRGILAALIGALLLWLGREPILEALGLSEVDETSNETESLAAVEELHSSHTDAPVPGDSND